MVGRVLAARSFGKLLFLTLAQEDASLQVTVRKGVAEDAVFAFAKELDVGDFVRAEGVLWRTQKGELSVDARALALLAKSLRPLPEKWHGLQDVEARYRQRYLDLIVNERARQIARTRSRAVSALRAFLDGEGFLEVETPILQPLYGGASARPFTTHYNAYDQNVFLRISDELYLKRLVIGGLERVYEIGRDFRNEGVDRKRNPEFTMMECYQAYADYRDMMRLTQRMLQHVVREVTGGLELSVRDQKIDLSGEAWPTMPLCEAIERETGVDVLAAPDVSALREAVRRSGREPGDAPTWGQLVDQIFSEHVEPKLVQPTFLTDYPVELSPLAKRSVRDPRLVERFELFVAGIELANAFSELNDPEDQRARFDEQRRAARRRRRGGAAPRRGLPGGARARHAADRRARRRRRPRGDAALRRRAHARGAAVPLHAPGAAVTAAARAARGSARGGGRHRRALVPGRARARHLRADPALPRLGGGGARALRAQRAPAEPRRAGERGVGAGAGAPFACRYFHPEAETEPLAERLRALGVAAGAALLAIAVAEGVVALLLRRVHGRVLARASALALGGGYGMLVGGIDSLGYALAPTAMAAAIALVIAWRRRRSGGKLGEGERLLRWLCAVLAVGALLPLVLPGPSPDLSGGGFALLALFGAAVVLGLLPLASAGFLEMRGSRRVVRGHPLPVRQAPPDLHLGDHLDLRGRASPPASG